MLAGMNVARFNFSHGDHEEQHGKYDRMRKVSKELNLPIAALLDTKDRKSVCVILKAER